MVKSYGKTVKLTDETLSLIEDYRDFVKSECDRYNIKVYLEELSYDKLIRMAVNDSLFMRQLEKRG